MSFDTNWDIEKYRSPHEPNYQWELRKTFMEHNKDRFQEDKLVCLAQTFANVEFMGCRYPKETMTLVEELSFGIVQEFRQRQKNVLKRTFVSGSDAAEARVNRVNKRKSETNPTPSVDLSNLKYGRFVSASNEPETSNKKSDEPQQAVAPVEEEQVSAPAKTTREGSKRRPIVWDIQDDSKTAASVAKPSIQSKSQNQRNANPTKKISTYNPRDPLSGFVIVRLSYSPDENPGNILNRSGGFCKMMHTTNYSILADGRHQCDVIVNNQTASSAISFSKNEARETAQSKALQNLSKKCYTLMIKSAYLSDGTTVSMENVDGTSQSNNALESDNVGHKLMKMMGWTGGGLGKEGSGISEPITPNAVFRREGFGAATSAKDFIAKIRKIIEDYAKNNSSYDLVFAPGFTNEQRKEMHNISRRLGLKSKSFGKSDDRFITISRKFSGNEIIEHLIARGGSTEKYDLIPPGEN